MVLMDTENEIATLKRKAFYLEVISTFATQLMSANSSDEIVWNIAKHTIDKLEYLDCIVYLLDEKENTLYQRAAHGPKKPKVFDREGSLKIKMGEGITGTVAQSGIGEIVSDISLDNRYMPDNEDGASEITIPIMHKDQVIGIIDSEHPEKNFYTQNDFEVLTTIAEMSSAKLQQVKTQEQLHAHKAMLEETVQAKTNQLQTTIEQLRQSHDAILDQNAEKEILIKEIHHRVKNNLQILSSLMNLQAVASDSKEVKLVFVECKHRIRSMSAIHDQLYMSDSLSEINVRQYMSDITIDLLHSFGAASRVKLIFEVEDTTFDIATSIPLGLLLNELVVNSLKHGIKDEEGELKISMKCKGATATLLVRDSGSGFTKTSSKDKSVGLELIATLTAQIDGEVAYSSDDTGTTCRLTFPSGHAF